MMYQSKVFPSIDKDRIVRNDCRGHAAHNDQFVQQGPYHPGIEYLDDGPDEAFLGPVFDPAFVRVIRSLFSRHIFYTPCNQSYYGTTTHTQSHHRSTEHQ